MLSTVLPPSDETPPEEPRAAVPTRPVSDEVGYGVIPGVITISEPLRRPLMPSLPLNMTVIIVEPPAGTVLGKLDTASVTTKLLDPRTRAPATVSALPLMLLSTKL